MTGGPKKKSQIPLIGVLAVKNQLVTRSELKAGVKECREADDPENALIKYFLSSELISKKNIQRLTLAAKAISIRQKEYKFGAIAMARGFINKSVLDLALEDQEDDIKSGRKPRLIGDMMVDAGLLTPKQQDYILKLQNRVRKPRNKDDGPATAVSTESSDSGGPGSSGKKEAKQVLPEFLPPEIIIGGIQFQLSSDFMGAFLTKTNAFDEDVSVLDIKEVLFGKGIVSGLMADEMIQGFVSSSGFRTQSFRIAKGVRAIQGQDAKIEFFFNIDYLKAGGMDEDGNIDFKQRGEIPLVEKGTVLAEKTPGVEARWGQNIYGDEVSAEKGRDRALRFGKGAVLSEDGRKLLAGVRGYPKYSLGGVVSVCEEYITGGDVDFETGHIEFDGNVNIKGCIKSGFKVRGNDVSAIELDGGIVEADGDLKVAGGINEGKIYARGNVYAKFIHDSEIICMGDVYVQKEIVDSTIESSGACTITNGKLISSRVSAKMGVNVRNIGTQMATPSVIKVGHDVFTAKELKQSKDKVTKIKEEVLKLKEKKVDVKSRNTALQKEITELAHVQDRAQLQQREAANQDGNGEWEQKLKGLKTIVEDAELNLDHCFEKSEALEGVIKKIDSDIVALNEKLNILAEERSNLTRWSKDNPGKAQVLVDGAILSGTTIIGKHCEYTVDKMIRHVRITEILFRSDEAGGERTRYQMKSNPL